MKHNNMLLWFILILFVGFVFWAITTGKLNSISGSFIDGIWNSIKNLLRPIFHQ